MCACVLSDKSAVEIWRKRGTSASCCHDESVINCVIRAVVVCVNERERLKGEEREKRTAQGRKKGGKSHSINLLQELAS